jgi:hypothetical protein
VHSNGGKTPHHHPSRPTTPKTQRSPDPVPFLYGEQIRYHVIKKYRYAGSIDVELIRQTL